MCFKGVNVAQQWLSKAITTAAAALLGTAAHAGVINNVGTLEFDRLDIFDHPEAHNLWITGAVQYDQNISCIISTERSATSYSQEVNRRGPEAIQFVEGSSGQTLRTIRGYSEVGATIVIDGENIKGQREHSDSTIYAEDTQQLVIKHLQEGQDLTVNGKSSRGTAVTDIYSAHGFSQDYAVYEDCQTQLQEIFSRNLDTMALEPQDFIGTHDVLSSMHNTPLFLGMHTSKEQAWRMQEVAYRLDARLPKYGEIISARFDMPDEEFHVKDDFVAACPAQNVEGSFADIEYAHPGDYRGEVAYTTKGFVPLDAVAQINVDVLTDVQNEDVIMRGQSQTLLMDGKALKVDISSNPDHKSLFNNGASGFAWGTVQVSPSTQQDPAGKRTQDGCAQGERILACISFNNHALSVAPPTECSAKFERIDTPIIPVQADIINPPPTRQPPAFVAPPRAVHVNAPATVSLFALGIGFLGLRRHYEKKRADNKNDLKV